MIVDNYTVFFTEQAYIVDSYCEETTVDYEYFKSLWNAAGAR
jgi:hypothetical protein